MPFDFMATHNLAMLAGYLLDDPDIRNAGVEGEEQAFLYLRTIRRESERAGEEKFEDIMIHYHESDSLMDQIKRLKRMDIIIVKGVLDFITADKKHVCPNCHAVNVKENGCFPFIRPIYLRKEDNALNSFEYDEETPNMILTKHYREISNFLMILGKLVTPPEDIGDERRKRCRYKLAVNRKYYIPSEPDVTADYPWVYSYGDQAERDLLHLELNSEVLVDGYYHTRVCQIPAVCHRCGQEYTYSDILMDLVPYSVEYLVYKTDEDIANEEAFKNKGLGA